MHRLSWDTDMCYQALAGSMCQEEEKEAKNLQKLTIKGNFLMKLKGVAPLIANPSLMKFHQ